MGMKPILSSFWLILSLCFIYVFSAVGVVQAASSCAADLNTDGVVDSADLEHFVSGFGRTACDPGGLFCPGNFDEDLDVDGMDAAFIAQETGRTDCVLTAADYLRPEVTLSVSPVTASIGDTVSLSVSVSDNDHVAVTMLQINGIGIFLDYSGTATFTSPSPGIFTAEATGVDNSGNTGMDRVEFRFLIPGDTTPPTVNFTMPDDNAVLTEPAQITGTAADNGIMLRYTLSCSVKGANEFICFSQGTTPVINDVLGTLDTTMLRNGLYEVRITAEDASGNISSAVRTFQVDGQLKTGHFSTSINDLTIPMTGIPITITRQYDSRIQTRGEFGFGWHFDFNMMKFEENRVPGRDWEAYCTRSLFGTCLAWGIRPTAEHRVVVNVEDNMPLHEFMIQANTTYAEPNGLTQGHLSFPPLAGTFSTLEALDNTAYDFLMGNELFDLDFRVLDPDRYCLTRPGGIAYYYHQPTGLYRMADANGNTIDITTEGIVHSGGIGVNLTRDTQGRITMVTDPMGNTIHYMYDFYSDLVSVTDQEGRTTWFTYDSSHRLLDIIDPNGIIILHNEYDDNGRLLSPDPETGY